MREDIRERIETIKRGGVPEGYRKTAAGIVPLDWEILKLGCEGEFKNGLNYNRSESKGNIKILGVGDFKQFNLIEDFNNVEKIECEQKKYKEYLLKDGDLVFVRSNGSKDLVGRCVMVYPHEQKVVYGGFCIRYRLNKKQEGLKSSTKYINYWMQNDVLKKLLKIENRGTNINNLNQEILNKLEIPIPCYDYQNVLCGIFEKQDKKIELFERLVYEKIRYKNGLMQMLISGKRRLKGFNHEWKKVKLTKVLRERKEYAQKDQIYEHVTLSKDGIYTKGERYDRDHLVKNEEKEYKVTHLNDICYNPANLKFGVICRNIYGDAIFSPIYITFEVDDKHDVEFISQYLMRWDFINAVRKYEEGTVYERMAVSPKDFLSFEVMLPQIDEQKAIAQILFEADKEIALLQQQLEQINYEKKAILQLLLTGIVRVNQKGGE